MTLRATTLIATLAICSAAGAAERPSGLEIWQTCRNDLRVVCPSAGINPDAIKSCVKANFNQLSARCQAVILRRQDARREEIRP
jgi:hypothetical protein